MNIKQTAGAFLLAVTMTGLGMPVRSDETADTWEKIVFHVDESKNARWAMMLANSYMDDSPKARIVFVAYGPGIDFLLEDADDHRGNPYDPGVRNLVERGVEFRLCAATLSARSIANEDVLDAAVIVPSGVSEIARMQLKEAYAYLKP